MWQGSWGAFFIDFGNYLFLAPNGQDIHVFGRWPLLIYAYRRRAVLIVKTNSFLLCPVKHRLSRAPPDSPRPRDRATPARHGHPQGLRRKIGRRSPSLGEWGAWKGAPGDGLLDPRSGGSQKKTWKSQHDTATILCKNVLTYCCTCRCAATHGGWVGRWIGGSGAVRAAAVVLL